MDDGHRNPAKRKRGPYGKRNYDFELEYDNSFESFERSEIQRPETSRAASSTDSKVPEDVHTDNSDDSTDDIGIIDSPSSINDVNSPGPSVDNSQDVPSADSLLSLGIDEATEREIIFRRDSVREAIPDVETDYENVLTLDREGEETDDFEYYLLRSQNDDCDDSVDTQPLYPGATVTLGSFMLLLAAFTTKFNLVGDAVQQLLNIITYALPSGHKLGSTLHEFKKYFTNLRNPLVNHYYCNHCLGIIVDTQRNICPHSFCGKPFNVKSANYFLEIPLQNQVKNMFKHENFYTDIQHRFNRNTGNNMFGDIYDGKLYQNHFGESGLLRNPNNLSFTLNTDGAPVFKSSQVSVWPVFLIINELPYKLRMKKENMILAQLWFGNQKPAMGTFLKPLQRAMNELYNGIQCFSPGQGYFTSQSILLCGTADLPARSLLCNHNQYNGAYACWKCEQEGISTPVGKGHARVFPFDEISPKGPERNVNNVLENARTVVHEQKNGNTTCVVKGIKGPSWLHYFPKFDIVSGIGIDYMHGVLLGVQKMLLELWFSTKYSGKIFNYAEKTIIVDSRMECIKPTLEITRLPRSLQDLKYWKASEYRSFLLYFGAPVLHDILDKTRFSHYLLLVNSMHILLTDGALSHEIDKAEEMLTRYCKMFKDLYGIPFMRLNLHQLLHLPDCVRNLGPLYTHSCFSFEDKNGVLLKMIKGTQHIDNQIVTGVSFLQKLPELKEKCIAKGSECEKLYNEIETGCLLKRTAKLYNNIFMLGASTERNLTAEERNALSLYLGHEPLQQKLNCFNRIEIENNLIYGLSYCRMNKRDNSTIVYKADDTSKFGQVRFFMVLENDQHTDVLAMIEKLTCPNYRPGVNILSVSKSRNLDVQHVRSITSSCMLISCIDVNKHFLCRFPNRLESD